MGHRKRSGNPGAPKVKGKKELPWRVVVAAVMLLIAVFFWGIVAADYANDVEHRQMLNQEGDRDLVGATRDVRAAGATMALISFGRFIGNAFMQIPNAPWVAGYAIKHRTGKLLVFVLIEVLVLYAGFALTKLDKALSKEPAWEGAGDVSTAKAERPVRPSEKKRRPLPPPGHSSPRRRRPK